MTSDQIPYDRLVFFQTQLGLDEKRLRGLEPYYALFIERKHEFASYFYDYFEGLPETRIYLDHEKQPGNLKMAWAHWFASLFGRMPDENLLAYLWRSGLKHVEINLDQRFVNLGYAIARKFCEQVVLAEVPLEKLGTVSGTVNQLLDLCLLVETHAYISATVQCDREVVRGIAHQVRNPVTVIGGNIRRLQKSLEANADSPVRKAYETIMAESRRLERMVADIRAYTEIFQTEGRFVLISLRSLISGALETLRETTDMEGITVEMDLNPDWPDVVGNPEGLRTMFIYLLENSLEAVLPANPCISISSAPLGFPPRFLQVVIFNTGDLPRLEDMDLLFTPFYSSKPTGTGFGLPIARLVAAKNLGSVNLVPMGEHGTRCVVTLPIPDSHKYPGG